MLAVRVGEPPVPGGRAGERGEGVQDAAEGGGTAAGEASRRGAGEALPGQRRADSPPRGPAGRRRRRCPRHAENHHRNRDGDCATFQFWSVKLIKNSPSVLLHK